MIHREAPRVIHAFTSVIAAHVTDDWPLAGPMQYISSPTPLNVPSEYLGLLRLQCPTGGSALV